MSRSPDWLLQQLPMGMLDDGFFVRFVQIFQEVATSYLDEVDGLEHTIEVPVAPDEMVRYVGSWIGLSSIDPSLPSELQRRIVTETGRNLPWRGTRRGLLAFLELVSGQPSVVEESGGIFREGEAPVSPPHVRMRVESTGWTTEEDFLALVRDELPANVTFELFLGERLLWPAPLETAAVTAGEGTHS